MTEAIAPTPERLRKSKFDTPIVDQTQERRAYRARDIWDEMLRREEIEMPEYRAAERFEHHYLGMMGHDVRITDMSAPIVDDPKKRRGWEKHVFALDEARQELMPKEFRALELLAMGTHDLKLVGVELSRYRNSDTARAYALRTVQGALERLSHLWDYRIKRPPIR